jgi:threonine aldolase
MQVRRGFASDNNSGIHPEILTAIKEANKGHCIAYGDDSLTQSAIDVFKKHFGSEIEVFFVFNGTASNVLSLKASLRSYHAVICAQTSHLNVDECGAPEHFAGCKLLSIPSENGKIYPEQIMPFLELCGNEHHSQPRVISITQATELGTVYTPEELKALSGFAHENGLFLHMDGARLCNAAASLNLGLSEISGKAGVDVLSFGGTKNGMMLGEAVVFFNRELAKDFKYIRKHGMQLFSKMRFVSAQFIAFLEDGLWLKNARHANSMAQLLARKLEGIPGCEITQKVEANAVFLRIPPQCIEPLKHEYFFYVWDNDRSIIRLMTSFDTEEEEIEGLVNLLKRLVQKHHV